MQDMVNVTYPDGVVSSWLADKESLAFPVMLCGVDDPQRARAFAADIYGDLVWGKKGSVTYDLPDGPTTFRLIEVVDTVEITPRAKINLALHEHWPWLVLGAAALIVWFGAR